MRRTFKSVFTVTALVMAPLLAKGEEISFDQVMEIALTKSLLVKEIEAQIGESKGQAIQAGLQDNPEFSAEIRPYVAGGDDSDTEYEISLSKPLKLSSFGYRSRVSRLMKQAVALERKIKLHNFVQNLKLSYGKAWALQERLRFVEEQLLDGKLLIKGVTDGAKAGVVPVSTEKLVAAEASKLRGEVSGLKADLKRALADLIRLSGMSPQNHKLKPFEFGEIQAVNTSDTDIPLTDRVRLLNTVAKAQRDLARLDSFPQFTPYVGFEHTDDGDDRIVAGVSIGLPFWDRNQGERTKFNATLDHQTAQVDYFSSDLFQSEIDLLLDATKALSAQLHSYSKEVIPALKNSLVASKREFKAGQGTPFQIWQIRQELLNSHERYLEIWSKILANRVELSTLLGKEL